MPLYKISPQQVVIPPQSKPTQVQNNESCVISNLSSLLTNKEEVISLSGLVPRHCIALQKVAIESGCIIAFRPVEPISTQLIDENYPTKNFHIKGKSSTWGPMAGFITVDQLLSKQEGSDKIGSSNQKVQECLKDGYAVSGHLEISAERLTYLINEGVLQRQGDTLYATGPSGTKYEFSVCANKDNGMLAITHRDEPVMVLCDPISKMPLTADYDLMLIATPLEQYGSKDIPPISDVSHRVFVKRANLYKKPLSLELQAQKDSPALFYEKEDKDLGNINQRVRELIPQLNKAMGCLLGREVVHHNMDATSPAADPSSNYPVTLFLPRKLNGISEVMILARNKEELAEIIVLAKSEGFYVPLNPLWEPEINSILRPNFVEARLCFANHKLK
ncbi:anthrax toxin-like adenylyl cyclase domain-containing protein [Iodobacter fluviatilis]|uniref:Calmodulin-sensitive adenylate cyclase n=1 Tax=Iodobacter fluviatilis TaxID=537 RepID=A0A377Q5U9_9NEIS|nr:anthrax toxin-like adenylyl cyclase domain-containing protein [Iodobacter fluviatilis]TCU80244.1 toxin LF subunit [Iodobacter fluviatilis]STQ90202.1 Calmodulin-sensitive adenylate cyclase precursor [Iodobacter fluviatilis]